MKYEVKYIRKSYTETVASFESVERAEGYCQGRVDGQKIDRRECTQIGDFLYRNRNSEKIGFTIKVESDD